MHRGTPDNCRRASRGIYTDLLFCIEIGGNPVKNFLGYCSNTQILVVFILKGSLDLVQVVSLVDILMDVTSSPRYRFSDLATQCLWSHHSPSDAESVLLGQFAAVMGDGDMTIVTWNGRGFDLPVLSMRSLKHGIPYVEGKPGILAARLERTGTA